MENFMNGILIGELAIVCLLLIKEAIREKRKIDSPVSISLVTKVGHTPFIRKLNMGRRHSPGNTVVGLIIYKGGKRIGYLENEKGA